MPDPFGFDQLDLEWLQGKQGAKWHRHPGTLAAWIADMDFRPAPVVAAALQRFLDDGELGYPDWRTPVAGTPIRELWVERCTRRYGWTPDPHRTREFCDVMQAVEAVLFVATAPGDGVVLFTPSYPPLRKAIEENGRRLVAHEIADGSWDLEALDLRLSGESARVLILCHPHNPTGHVFSDDELQRIAVIADRHDLVIISDEIHADLTYAPLTHRPMAHYAPDHTVTVQSASKSFNLAGLRYAIAHVGPLSVFDRLEALPGHLLGAISVPAAVATHAAWTEGDEWLAAVLAHLDRNRMLLGDLLRDAMPDVQYTPPQGTYLAWLDCRALDLDDPVEDFRSRGVSLSAGPDFGEGGAGFVRLNFATSADVLAALAGRMSLAV